MDETDLGILHELEKDSRQTNIEIAKKLKISEGTVRKRIDALIQSGVIKRFTVDVSTKDSFVAFVLIKCNPQISTAEIVSKLKTSKEIKQVYEAAGEWDIILMTISKSAEEFNGVIERIRTTKGVVGTKSLTVLKVN